MVTLSAASLERQVALNRVQPTNNSSSQIRPETAVTPVSPVNQVSYSPSSAELAPTYNRNGRIGPTPLAAQAQSTTTNPKTSAEPKPTQPSPTTDQKQVQQQQQAQAELLKQLQARDQEVRQHERAHAAAGGAHAGSPEFEYLKGPDGKSYANAGEVSIDISAVAGDPAATISKMQIVQAAATAPAEPSPQDRKVAATAAQIERKAQRELLQQNQQLTEQNPQRAKQLGQYQQIAANQSASSPLHQVA